MSRKSKLQFIKSFGKLELKDGDTLVLKSESKLSVEVCARIKEHIKHLLGDLKIKVLVLDGGMDIGILRKEEAKDAGQAPHCETSDHR